jgi:hypothetical protein
MADFESDIFRAVGDRRFRMAQERCVELAWTQERNSFWQNTSMDLGDRLYPFSIEEERAARVLIEVNPRWLPDSCWWVSIFSG